MVFLVRKSLLLFMCSQSLSKTPNNPKQKTTNSPKQKKKNPKQQKPQNVTSWPRNREDYQPVGIICLLNAVASNSISVGCWVNVIEVKAVVWHPSLQHTSSALSLIQLLLQQPVGQGSPVIESPELDYPFFKLLCLT